MTDPVWITGYHAHVYYDADTRAVAAELRAAIEQKFGGRMQMGRWREEPVGPHPRPTYQVAFDTDEFAAIVPWLMLNRAGLTVLVHPETGRPRDDHLLHALWMVEVAPLDESALPEST